MKRSIYFASIVYLFAVTGILLSACTRPVNIDVPTLKDHIVVNCLFNPDSTWKVYVGKIKALSDSGKFTPVSNATVQILGENQPISLRYRSSGNYEAIGKKPKSGIDYNLKINIPGHSTINATSRIPKKAAIEYIDFDTIPTYFVPDNGFDNVKVNQVNIALQLPESSVQYYELLAYKYPIDAYCEFVITDEVLDKLQNYTLPDEMAGNGLSDEYINRLKYFKDVPIKGKKHFFDMIARQTGTHSGNYLVYEFAKKIRHSPKAYDSSKFKSAELFSKDLHFYNITGDSHGVFGTYSNPVPAGKDTVTLFLSDLSYTGNAQNGMEITEQNEGWLDIISMSKVMYKYQTTYLNQMINEQNPFAQPVQVFSNIKNGIGIFAGYQKQSVKMY